MEQLRSLIKKLLQFRFVRFCITGGLNTLVDFIVFFLLTGSLNWPGDPFPGHQLQCRDSQQLLYQPPLDLPDPEPVLRTGNAVVHRSKSLCAGSQRTVHVGAHHTDGLRDDPQQALYHCPDHGAGICTQPAAGFPQPRIVSKNRRPESSAVCFIISLCVCLLNYK